MNSFAVGLVAGVGAVLLAGVVFASGGMGLLSGIMGDPVGALQAGEVVIGTFSLNTSESRHFGVLVYAATPDAARALAKDIAQYSAAPPDITPPQVRDALCAQAGCDNRTGTVQLLDDVQGAMDAVVNRSVLHSGEGLAHLTDEGGSILVIAIASAPPGSTVPLGNAATKLDAIRDKLQAACESLLPEERTNSPCEKRYVQFNAFLEWNPSPAAFLNGTKNRATVLGPVSWTTDRAVDAADAAASRKVTYLPMAALLLPLAVVALAISLQELAERKGWNPFLPLPPFAALAAIVAVGVVALHPEHPRILTTFGIASAVLFIGWLALYRVLDLAGVQFYSSLAAGVSMLAVVGALVVGVGDLIERPAETLVTSVYNANASAIAQATVVRALAAAAAVSIAALLVALVASVLAYREGKEKLPQRDLEHALDRETGGVWQELHRLDPNRPDGLSPSAFASVVARFYGRARWAQGGWWLTRDIFWCSPKTKQALPGLRWAAVPGAPRPGEDPMDVLWWRHGDSARRGRGR